VLFCEILEHLAFNPVDLWKEIYRVLRAPGRIVLTTPNANYWPHLNRAIQRLQTGHGWGPTVADIMTVGTFGHHWKEYTAREVEEYFARLSADFRVSRCEFEQTAHNVITDLRGAPPLPADELSYDTMFMEIALDAKSSGISIDPPWRAQYR
jgi:SAM-dependent methyltransferase